MRRLVALCLGLLVLNTTVVQSAFACEAMRAALAQQPSASVSAHHHAPASGHHHAPEHSRGSNCAFMLACAAVSAPAAYVAHAVVGPTGTAVIEMRAAQPYAPPLAPETPPPRA